MEREAYEEMRRLEDRHWWFRGRRAAVEPLLGAALAPSPTADGGPRTPVLLDLGCGTGGNLAHVRARFPEVRALGIDLDGGALRACAGRGLGAALVRARSERIPVAAGSVDCVIALDVLEHFDDDRAVLAEIARVLRPGGVLVASVPAHPWLWSPHDEFLHHRRRYRARELAEKLAGAGLAVERLRGWNFLLLPVVAAVRLARRSASRRRSGTDFAELPRAVDGALASLLALEARIARVAPVPTGVSLVASARRP